MKKCMPVIIYRTHKKLCLNCQIKSIIRKLLLFSVDEDDGVENLKQKNMPIHVFINFFNNLVVFKINDTTLCLATLRFLDQFYQKIPIRRDDFEFLSFDNKSIVNSVQDLYNSID